MISFRRDTRPAKALLDGLAIARGAGEAKAPIYLTKNTSASLPSASSFTRVDHDLDLLRSFPELGKKYDPVYDAARPPFDCRVLYCEQYGIYYRVDDDSRRVVVFAIVDQRRNPKTRFDGYEYGAVGLE